MKLSIITINFNNRKGLQKTINSVISQTFTDYEWIVIDGGSTDGSKELIEQYADKFAYWCSEPDNGIYNAMNKGMAYVHGDYTHFLNSGDWLYEDTTYDNLFKQNLYGDVVFGNVAVFFYDNWIYHQKFDPPTEITPTFFYTKNLCHQSVFLSFKTIQNTKYDELYKISADYKSYFQYMLDGRTFQQIDQCICYYDANGISSKNAEQRALEQKMIRKELISPAFLRDLDDLSTIQSKIQPIQNRRSLSFVMKTAYSCLLCIDSLLRKIDRRKHH